MENGARESSGFYEVDNFALRNTTFDITFGIKNVEQFDQVEESEEVGEAFQSRNGYCMALWAICDTVKKIIPTLTFKRIYEPGYWELVTYTL